VALPIPWLGASRAACRQLQGEQFMAPQDASPQPVSLAQALFKYGATPADLEGVTQDELEATYHVTYELMMSQQYDQAVEYAELLVRLDPGEHRFLFAFALCLQHLDEFESAANFYAQALVLRADDAVCAFRIGECMVALEDLDNARTAFEMCVQLSWLSPDYAEVRELSQQRLDTLFRQGA
jgi:type III secretion system low calcium response chaperone LcrH/SycD